MMIPEHRVNLIVTIGDDKREYNFDGFILIGCNEQEDQSYTFDFAANMPLEIGAAALKDIIDSMSDTEEDH